ncbi:MAG: alkaline phosphatase family protein [Candidatus Nitrosocaldus sp.]
MRLLVIGLDSMPADLLSMKDELPNIGRMMSSGIAGVLESCHPPITIPAWMVMMTSKSPTYPYQHSRRSTYPSHA